MASKMVQLRSEDGQVFEVEEGVAFQSRLMKDMMEDLESNDNVQVLQVPLPGISARILAKVLEYCKAHYRLDPAASTSSSSSSTPSTTPDASLESFDAKFVRVEKSTLLEMVMAANYLNIPTLLDLTCQTTADLIRDKSPEYVRSFFNIENDFTPEEEAAVRKENAWAFESY